MNTTDPIRRRDIDFGMDDDIPRHWLGGDAQASRFYDALSIMFPEGERFFIESVRHFRAAAAADPKLAADVTGFIGQEAMHRREHIAYNGRLAAQGAPIAQLEQRIIDRQDFMRRTLPLVGQLAVTICVEHFTAMLANQVLAHPENLRHADPRMARIWRWHAVEETEHKAVAFDVFTRGVPNPLMRYLRRCHAMLWVTSIFIMQTWTFHVALLRVDRRASDWRGWARFLYRQFVSPGPLIRIIPEWLAWFVPGFHPWWFDNRARLEAAKREYDDIVNAPARPAPSAATHPSARA